MITAKSSCFLVDLDDTLYSELDYVDSGYRAVAPLLADAADVTKEAALLRLRYEMRKQGRAGAFDRALEYFQVDQHRAIDSVKSLVAAYRDHRPDIAFYPGARDSLILLRQQAPVAIVTDGTPLMQQRKIEALGLASHVDAIVFCWEFEAPKPAVRSYELAAERVARDLSSAVVIGDDPLQDMAAAAALGVRGLRVRTGRLADLDVCPNATRVEEFPNFVAAVAALTG